MGTRLASPAVAISLAPSARRVALPVDSVAANRSSKGDNVTSASPDIMDSPIVRGASVTRREQSQAPEESTVAPPAT